MKAAPEELYYSQQPLLSERRARSARVHNRGPMAPEINSQVATVALRSRGTELISGTAEDAWRGEAAVRVWRDVQAR